MVTRFAGNRIEDFLSPGVRFDDMGADAVGAAAADFGEAIIGNARMRNAQLMADAELEAAKANQDASRSISNAAQGANTIGTVAGVVGGLGSAAIMKFGGGGGGNEFGKFGDYSGGLDGTPYPGAFTPGGSDLSLTGF